MKKEHTNTQLSTIKEFVERYSVEHIPVLTAVSKQAAENEKNKRNVKKEKCSVTACGKDDRPGQINGSEMFDFQ